jgi:type IV fimbrial biogenesis protein FimT
MSRKLTGLGRCRRSRGYTLLEVVTVLAVVAILAAIGLPAFQHLLQRQRVDTAMHLLTSYMASARLTAINRRAITAVCPSNGRGGCRKDGDWTHGWLMFLDKDGNRRPDDPRDILRDERAPIHPSLRIVSSSGRPQFRYLPDGRSGGSNLTVELCQDGALLGSVIVSMSGRVRSKRPTRAESCKGQAGDNEDS